MAMQSLTQNNCSEMTIWILDSLMIYPRLSATNCYCVYLPDSRFRQERHLGNPQAGMFRRSGDL